MSGSRFHSIVDAHEAAKGQLRFQKPPGMTWRDYLIALLHVAAEVEHGLMVQYLYAAYSLGGPGLTEEQAAEVAGWQKNILDVAKEEMGHLLTVQNLLALLGAPPNLTRTETPFEEALSPIPFSLEPLTREVAASFTFAEMSPDLELHLATSKRLRRGLEDFLDHHQLKPLTKETRRLSRSLGSPDTKPQPVALLYEEVIRVIGDEALIPDSDFDETSYEAQASWDDWGRGYAPDPKRLSATGDLVSERAKRHRANVIVMRAATRTDALQALRAISGQGEAIHLQHPHKLKQKLKEEEEDGAGAEASHFERFLAIWQHYPQNWRPYRNVMRNPATRPSAARHRSMITDPQALDWAVLFNLRYRMLLSFLAHSFRLSRVTPSGVPGLRGMIMHRAFGEMYNLKAVAGILVRLKVSKHGEPDLYAGPPFETPYSLNMPPANSDCFRLHRDLYLGALDVNEKLQANTGGPAFSYLKSLHELDRAALRWIETMLRAPAERERA